MDPQLNDFYTHLNDSVVTTNDFAEGTKYRKREKVEQYAYCGLNQMYRSYLSFDIDRRNSANYFEHANLPTPTIITINPQNAHCHYLYRLKTPVAYHANSRSAPQDYFEAIQNEMEDRLRADMAYNHTITKNPLHPRWRVQTYPTSYDLEDFLEYIELPTHKTRHSLPNDVWIRGRNDRLFHTLRMWAYGAVHAYEDRSSFECRLHNEASHINTDFDVPLPLPEIKQTVKSIAQWVWKHQDDVRSARAKVMQFAGESAHQRMSMGADYTNTLRREKSLQTLRNAIANNPSNGGSSINISQLAKASGLNIKTVRKYLPLL